MQTYIKAYKESYTARVSPTGLNSTVCAYPVLKITEYHFFLCNELDHSQSFLHSSKQRTFSHQGCSSFLLDRTLKTMLALRAAFLFTT